MNSITETEIKGLEGYMQLRHLYTAAVKEITTKVEILDEEFKFKFDHNPIHHIESRLKSPISIAHKLERKGLDINLKNARQLHDIAGIRIVCRYLDDCYKMAKMLLMQNDITFVEQKDYIKSPKPNGYRSLHLIIKIPIFLSDRVQNVPVEIQIRTIGMDFWASLDHELRYKAPNTTEDITLRLKKCADEMSILDDEMQKIRSECIKE